MIILCIISIYSLSYYSYFLLTLETVKHFPNVHILVGFSTSRVSSWYNGISEERVLLVSHCFFLVFQFLTPASKAFLIQFRFSYIFGEGGIFHNSCFLGKVLKSEIRRQRFQNVFLLICWGFKNLVESLFLRAGCEG